MLRVRLPSHRQGKRQIPFPALDRKGGARRPLRAPDSSGNFGLNLVDQGYRTRPIKVTAHIHWKDPKQERSMEVDFREVCLCSE